MEGLIWWCTKYDSGPPTSPLPPPADQDLPICVDPPTLEEVQTAIRSMKSNKAAGLDCAVTAEALQGGGELMANIVHAFCVEVFTRHTPPEQWVTNVIVPLPKKGDLSLMTNYRGITLMSIAAKVYNKVLLMRIRDHVDPMLRKNQAGFRPGRSCSQQIHILQRIMEAFGSYHYHSPSLSSILRRHLIPLIEVSCSQLFVTTVFQRSL